MYNFLTFGQALEELKSGKKISRQGWNGKNMFVYLNMGIHDFGEDRGQGLPIEGIKSDLFLMGDVGTVTRLPNINMMSATGSTVTGWLASQTDLLAEDWGIVE